MVVFQSMFVIAAGGALALDAQPGAGGTPTFPDMFVETWGVPGPACRTDVRHRYVVNRDHVVADRLVMTPVSIDVLAHNSIRVRFRADGESHVETLTVGTTGSRLFRDRPGMENYIYWHCG